MVQNYTTALLKSQKKEAQAELRYLKGKKVGRRGSAFVERMYNKDLITKINAELRRRAKK